MANARKVENLKLRARILREVRSFFVERDFVEVETPLLVPNPGLEPYLVPFETTWEPGMGGGKARTYYLPTSPEYHLKKALALGLPRVFEISRSFRNGEKSRSHEPEFSMLEWYRHPGGYAEIADDFASLLARLGAEFAPAAPWKRRQDLSVCEAFRSLAGIDLEAVLKGEGESLASRARAQGFASVQADDDFETAFHKVMLDAIEAKLGFEGPLFLWDYPSSMCALARLKPEKPYLCERFEVYFRGVELANCFGELTDPVEQRVRCEADRGTRMKLYGKTPPIDEEFLSALAKLDQPAGGIAVGLDRVVQLLIGAERIQDVIAFPHADSL